MRLASLVVAVAVLVAIGTVESSISVQELSELPGRERPPLGVGGIGLTAASILASAIVFLLLGLFLARKGHDAVRAVRAGLIAGIFSGLIGGAIRALLVRDYLDDVVERFGLPLDFASWSLIVFVALSVLVTAVSGGAITWLGFRGARRPPRPRPPS